eukprot:3204204-Pyramimonas_sp.AAC.1
MIATSGGNFARKISHERKRVHFLLPPSDGGGGASTLQAMPLGRQPGTSGSRQGARPSTTAAQRAARRRGARRRGGQRRPGAQGQPQGAPQYTSE